MFQKLDKEFLWPLRDVRPSECCTVIRPNEEEKMCYFVPVCTFVKISKKATLNHKIHF